MQSLTLCSVVEELQLPSSLIASGRRSFCKNSAQQMVPLDPSMLQSLFSSENGLERTDLHCPPPVLGLAPSYWILVPPQLPNLFISPAGELF